MKKEPKTQERRLLDTLEIYARLLLATRCGQCHKFTDMRRCLTLILLVALLNTSCDPDITVDYNITNNTDEELEVKIFELRDLYLGILQEYDTVIGQGAKINIYVYSEMGSDYINPADTITIFDSIQVVKNSMIAKPDFKKLETWDYSEKRYKYGGGHFVYDLIVTGDDF